jgi:hypothetical protein
LGSQVWWAAHAGEQVAEPLDELALDEVEPDDVEPELDVVEPELELLLDEVAPELVLPLDEAWPPPALPPPPAPTWRSEAPVMRLHATSAPAPKTASATWEGERGIVGSSFSEEARDRCYRSGAGGSNPAW